MIATPHVSVFLFLRDEAHLAYGSLLSVQRAVRHLERSQATADVTIVVPARATATIRWAHEMDFFPVLAIDDERSGVARNAAARRASGTHLAFIDADTIWSEEFLGCALASDLEETDVTVWRPEFLIHFPQDYSAVDEYSFSVHPDSRAYDPASILEGNPFPGTWLARAGLLERVPFPIEDHDRGWSDAGRWWVANLLGAGIRNFAVPDTVCYVRARQVPPSPPDIGPTVVECGVTRAASRGLLVKAKDA